jgi:hypothetical protein
MGRPIGYPDHVGRSFSALDPRGIVLPSPFDFSVPEFASRDEERVVSIESSGAPLNRGYSPPADAPKRKARSRALSSA